MRLSVDARLLYRFPQAAEVLLLIEAADTPRQRVLAERLQIPAADDVARVTDPVTGERHTLFTARGDMEITYVAEVEVAGETGDFRAASACRIRDLPADTLQYMRPSRYCPSDRFGRFVERQFGALSGGAKVLAILDWVGGHLDYEAGASNAFTTASDTLLEAAGVCRDFTHLAIAMIRAADIPARAVSAYAWRLEPPDLHAVVEVFLDGRWWLADPTGRAPVDGLVRVVAGHDAADIAFMSIFGRAVLLEQSFSVQRVGALEPAPLEVLA